MTTEGILLARHGETDDNAARRFQGHRNPPLNARGREQAQALALQAVALGVRELWSSPQSRAYETAATVARELGLGVHVDARLVEVDVGAWAGRTYDDLATADPDGFAAWEAAAPAFRFPGGESLAEQDERVREVLAEVASRARRPVLVVCHGGVIRAAHRAFRGAGHGREVVANGSVHPL
jgi:broad specificity phosphatase PhoE